MPALARIRDPAVLRAIVEACVLPDLILDKSPDAAERWLADTRNVALRIGEDCGLFEYFAPGVYECHTLIRSGGRTGLDHCRRALDHMRDHYGARTFYGETPIRDDLKHAHWFNRKMGFEAKGEIERPHGRCTVYVLHANSKAETLVA